MTPADESGTLIIVGRSGNGKASVEKSILQVKPSSLHLVRSCSIGDTGEDLQVDYYADFVKVVDRCKSYGGIDAILLVLKYGSRFTKQEKDAVAVVKSVFGNTDFSRRGIIVMTYGDLFETDVEESSNTSSFEEWCSTQTGDMSQLIREVDKRIVLFDNRTKEESKKKKQFESLMEFLRQIKREVKYRKIDLDEAKRRYGMTMAGNNNSGYHGTFDVNTSRCHSTIDVNGCHSTYDVNSSQEEMTTEGWTMTDWSIFRAKVYFVFRWISSGVSQLCRNSSQSFSRFVQWARKVNERGHSYQRVSNTELYGQTL
ncbi:hypothetical protein Btru_047719 [Bulinus truncatus]|nr:hypothetical protein Btru_047719 [Bulinus truncatus]